MAAQSLNCPNCGAAVSSDATRCEHCDSQLATVACPSCFGMIFQGAKFCSHCGSQISRASLESDKVLLCPRCRVNTAFVAIGGNELRECPRCEGLWADVETLQQICADRERQSALLGTAMTIEPASNDKLETVRYIPCPVCQELMHRVNFARCSAVIVDVCKPHGTWFDKEELRRVMEFIRAGGFDKARAVEIEELKQQRRRLEAARAARGAEASRTGSLGRGVPDTNLFEFAIGGIVVSLADSFFN